LPALHDAVALLLADSSSWRMELGTYEREAERYGGDSGIELAERLFEADSDAVLEILEQAQSLGRDDRWRVALCGIDRLFTDLGLDAPGKQSLSARLRDNYVTEHHPPAGLRRQLGERFRAERNVLEALLAGDTSRSPAAVRHALDALGRRSERLAPIVRELRALDAARDLTMPLERIAPSFAHMFANRLLRFAARDQELVLYDFLSRLYEARAARSRVKAGPGAPGLSSELASEPHPHDVHA
jgi:thiopeptide-type bacteriocin biosynthesis protein